jgi:CheY-like chemotaxis protein
MVFQRVRELSLRQRLLFLTMVTSGFGVLLGCIGFLAYDMHVARQQKVEELRSTGDLLGMNWCIPYRWRKRSTFAFTVPFLIATGVTPAPPEMAHPGMMNERTLVVDDNEINRNLLMQILPQWGLQTACAANGLEALELFKKSMEEGAVFSVVLLDQNMPGMDGYEVAEKIRLLAKKDQPVIVILSSAPSSVRACDGRRRRKILVGWNGWLRF